MILVRQLDERHDMRFDFGLASCVECTEAVAQNVKTRILLLKGEWFLDLSAGLPWLQKIMVKPASVKLANLIIRKTIQKTPGVSRIMQFSSYYDENTRKLFIEATVLTIYDEITTIKVTK